MPYTTGIITNTRAVGTAATNVAVSVRNLSAATANIIVEIFAVPITTLSLVPVYVSGYAVAAGTVDIREFTIAGNVAYEVQLSNTSILANVTFSSFGLDEFGNLVTEQRALQSELTFIEALSIPI